MKNDEDEYEVEKKIHKHNNNVVIFLILVLIAQVCVLDYKVNSVEKSIVDITAIEQTQLDLDSMDLSELKKAIERLDCYEKFMDIVEQEMPEGSYYTMTLKLRLLQSLLNETKSTAELEQSIVDRQQKEFEEIGQDINNLGQGFSNE
jgi:hypothetical protein